ncbi:MAG: dicarboxylate/amino acid:cation symporter, partial [bacterium]
GNFLPIIVFAILFGIALRAVLDAVKKDENADQLELLISISSGINQVLFRIVDWILEYAPIGVLALSMVNFGIYGPKIIGPYITVVLGVVLGIAIMILVVYSVLIYGFTGKNPFKFFKDIRKPMLTAFLTRSSAATLPVSLKTAHDELRVKNELAGFSLPLGATINMDGVCVHLPMFTVLAANMFGLELSITSLFVMVITTVLAAIGAGGVPGGSLMLLFIILETLGLSANQTAVIVALALGVNPILDMFETMNNVTGDIVCTYAVAEIENLVEREV